MCNDHSNNLDHFDNMHFLREKWRCLDRWRIRFLWQTLLETSEIYRLWREFNYHLLWVNCFVCISKEKGLRAETNVNICHLQFATCYFVSYFDKFRPFAKTNQVICVYMYKSDHTTEWLIHYIGCISHVFGMYLICVGTTFFRKQCSTIAI